jgi:hypothetical protein
MNILVVGHSEEKPLYISNYIVSRTMRDRWTDEDIKQMAFLSETKTDEEISKIMKKNIRTIRWHRQKLGLNRWSNPKILKLNFEQRGYLAGILDGEGSVCISKQFSKRCINQIRLRPSLKIAMTSKETIDNIYSWLSSVGFKVGYYKHKTKWKDVYVVEIMRPNEIVEFINGMPYLFDKRIETGIMMKFCKSRIENRLKHKVSYTQEEIELFNELKGVNEQ